MSKKSIPNRVRKGKWFFVTFFMNSGCFFVVFSGPFFAAAFSNGGRSRKVRQVSLICYLHRILTILKVRVLLQNQEKKEIPSEISMRKTGEIMFEISLKNWCQKHRKSDENWSKMGAETESCKNEPPNWDFSGFLTDFREFWAPAGDPKSPKNRKNAEKNDPEKRVKKVMFRANT